MQGLGRAYCFTLAVAPHRLDDRGDGLLVQILLLVDVDVVEIGAGHVVDGAGEMGRAGHHHVDAGRRGRAEIENPIDVGRSLGGIGQVVEDQQGHGDFRLPQLVGHQHGGVGAVGVADDDDRIAVRLVGRDDIGKRVVPLHEVLGNGGNAPGIELVGERVHAGGKYVEAAPEDVNRGRIGFLGGCGRRGGGRRRERHCGNHERRGDSACDTVEGHHCAFIPTIPGGQ